MSHNSTPHPNWKAETFPETRTIPDKWEASALGKVRENTSVRKSAKDNWKPEPFPEPRGIPWDSGR